MTEIGKEELGRDGWVSQSALMKNLLPRIRKYGRRCKKFKTVRARPARKGERVTSVTSAGYETKNSAASGDFVVENLTSARERYLVDKKTFNARYEVISQESESWCLYEPIGEVIGVNVDHDLLAYLDRDSPFYIEAPWGEPQSVIEGDFLVTPTPDFDEIYRIGRLEFVETYKEVNT